MKNLILAFAVLLFMNAAPSAVTAQQGQQPPTVTGTVQDIVPADDPNLQVPLQTGSLYYSADGVDVKNNGKLLVGVSIRARLYKLDGSIPVGGNPWGEPVSTHPLPNIVK